MNDIIPFEYEGRPVRVVERDGEAWFVAADVCAVLGLEQVTRAIDSLDDDERALTEIKGADGRLRQSNLISEPGMWRLVMRSDKPQAKPFQRFVTHDVLPSIRKTGRYAAPNAPEVNIEELVDRAVRGRIEELVDRAMSKALTAKPYRSNPPEKKQVPSHLLETYNKVRRAGHHGVERDKLALCGGVFINTYIFKELLELKRMKFIREYTHRNGLIMYACIYD